MRLRLFLLVGLLCSLSAFAQIQSPEQFLGYKIGSRFTPHWKIIDYVKYLSTAAPTMLRLQTYGQTYEGRPLVVAYISSDENLAHLEAIRTNNLKLADLSQTGTSTQAPAIVWLSYNVHGNEASSSEAAMLTLYALVDPSNRQTKEWLQNTLVIVDPCMNPDGRDRYVNWFNSVVGRRAVSAGEAREHQEPWPGGRTNHYNFDLNRDWAWQTQKESQQRLALFNQWMPQIHVDFHEQGINSPYYFAPAAEPYHEVITPWQRQFQKTIGLNHARYFDEKGWLYFTKEVFDLLYPSYGDTYPLYNGAIGMTYEQAGNGSAGVSVFTGSGDTLTLYDRAMHHYTTSLSTIEVASKNAGQLITEFHNFFANAASKGVGEYKSYVVKNNPADRERIFSLLELLKKNNIEFGAAKASSQRGFSYEKGKEENFSVATSDIVISSVQPKGALVKVLFEPNAVLADSATYDITAWSLPYVFGLKTYATKDKVETSSEEFFSSVVNELSDAYAYVIRWSGMQSAKLVAQLLQKGIRLRFSQRPFNAGGQEFERGAVIVLKGSNQGIANWSKTVTDLANEFKVPLTKLNTGFVEKGYDFGSSNVVPLRKRRIALLTGDGVSANAAGEVWHFFDEVLNYPLVLINASDLNEVAWQKYDVIIMPSGTYNFFNNRNAAEQLRDWVNRGGNLIAMENAVAQLAKFEWSIKQKKEDSSSIQDPYSYLKKYENRERDYIPNITPGSIFKVQLDNTHPLAFGYPDYYYTLKQDDAIYEFIKEGGWNVGVLKKEKQIAGFVGSRLANKLQDGLLFGVQELGRGNIIYMADDVLFRSFWENGKLMFANAVFFVGQ